MAIAVAKFEVVDEAEAPKVTKVMSKEERETREAYASALKNLPAGKSLKLNLADVGGENPARSLGITLGHVIKDAGLSDQFTTSNDGKFYYVTRKASKAASNGANGVARTPA